MPRDLPALRGEVRRLFAGLKRGDREAFHRWRDLANLLLSVTVARRNEVVALTFSERTGRKANLAGRGDQPIRLRNGRYLLFRQVLAVIDDPRGGGPRLKVVSSNYQYQEDPEGKPASRSKLPVHSFAELAQYYMQTYGVTREHLAQIAVKSHYNASLNPYAHFQRAVTLEEVQQARLVADPFTVMHCCPWDEGAAAVVVCAREVAARFTRQTCPTIVASVLQSTQSADVHPVLFPARLTAAAARAAYERSGYGPQDLHLIELHDAFTIEELLYYEALGLVAAGEGVTLLHDGSTALTGRIPVNSSGGLISMGHPLGPTGLGQIAEILWQMRRTAGPRQIPHDVHVALAHMLGAGGVCVMHILRQ